MWAGPHGRHTGAPLQTPVVIALTRKQHIDRRSQALNLKWQIIPYREGLDVSALNWRRKTRMASRRLLIIGWPSYGSCRLNQAGTLLVFRQKKSGPVSRAALRTPNRKMNNTLSLPRISFSINPVPGWI